jgi:hypothetical protein
MTQMIADAARHANLSALDQAFESSGNIDPIAEDVTLLDHDIADIDADPEAHLSPFRLNFVGALQRLLNLDCTENGIEDADKFGEHTIAGRVCDATSMPADEAVDHGAMGGQCCHCRLFITVHQAGIALDIRGEDGRETSLDRRSLHRPVPAYLQI